MIQLTSINGKSFLLNSSLIYRIDKSPDSIITLRRDCSIIFRLSKKTSWANFLVS
jgi:uncharacterized protein YlzI (FlbEa/FlbD family)